MQTDKVAAQMRREPRTDLRLPLKRNSDVFVFDNQILSQAIYKGFRVGEISCPTRYFPEASSINFRRGVIYGFGMLRTSISFRLARLRFDRGTIFEGMRRFPLIGVKRT